MIDREELASDILEVEALNHRVFATLEPGELELFERFRREGRKHRLFVYLEPQEEAGSEFWSELEAASSTQQEDAIHRRYGSKVRVRGML
jgi:hypothetical protein